MKKQLLIPIFIFVVFACKKDNPAFISIKNDLNYKKAESFMYKDNDSAFYYFNEVATNSNDSLRIAAAYNYMAIIQADAGDYFGSIESALTSLPYLDDTKKEHFSCLASNYNELGFNNNNLRNYNESLKYLNLALKYAQNEQSKRVVLNNKALAYRGKKQYAKAIQIYQEIISKNKGNSKAYARSLTNLAITKWLKNPSYNAKRELLEALHIREKEKDWWGQNSSYAHLADYYTKSHPNLALFYARKRYAIAKQLNSADDQIGALRELIALSPADSTKQYFETYQRLTDSVQLARSAATNQFALIRYEVEKNKADNLKLQKENAEKAYQINRQRILTAAVFLLAVIFVISAWFWYKKRKQRLTFEAQTAIRESQLKTSKKVHDVVANGIYRVMAEIENQNNIDRESVLDRLENMYEKSRDISYETEESTAIQQSFSEEVADMLKSFAKESAKIVIVGNTPILWQNLNEPAKYEVGHILQELMVNMRKHSHATNVAILFSRQDNHIYIHYTDNGVGLSTNFRYNNGLANTGNRIKSLDGQIIFDTKVEKGLKIHISFPIS